MSLYSVKVSLKLRAGVAQRPIFALAFDGFLPLVVGGIAGIDDSGHGGLLSGRQGKTYFV